MAALAPAALHATDAARALRLVADTPGDAELVREIAEPELRVLHVGDLGALLDPYLRRLAARVEAPRAAMERLVAGDSRHARALRYESRPLALALALEMMGLLVDYYRVGRRRRLPEGDIA